VWSIHQVIMSMANSLWVGGLHRDADQGRHGTTWYAALEVGDTRIAVMDGACSGHPLPTVGRVQAVRRSVASSTVHGTE
jgi:hypothetical protein